MDTKKFLQAMNDIDDKYIAQADIFAPEPPAKRPVVFRVLHWAGGVAACALVAAGLWFMWDMGLLADINDTSQPTSHAASAPDETASQGETPAAAMLLSEDDVSIDRVGNLTFSDPEFQEMYRVFLEHEPTTTGEDMESLLPAGSNDGSATRVLTLTLPLYIVEKYRVGERTHILCELQHTDYIFRKSADDESPAYLEVSTRFGDLAGAIGYYDENGRFFAEQPWYSTDDDRHFDSIQEFTGRTDKLPGEHPEDQKDVNEDAYLANEKREELYKTWEESGGEELIHKLLYSYLEQNSLTEYARLKLPGAVDFIELAPDAAKTSDYSGDYRDAVSIDEYGSLSFLYEDYQEIYRVMSGEKPVETGSEAVSEAADDSCVQTLRITLPCYVIQQFTREDGNAHIVFLLEEIQYGFFDRDGVKTVRPIGGYSDVAGITAETPVSAMFQGIDAWYPESGERYLPSIAEFTGLTEDEASALLERAEREKFSGNAYELLDALTSHLLYAYMGQNNMTGYELDGRQITDDTLHEAATRNATTSAKIRMEQAQREEAAKQADTGVSSMADMAGLETEDEVRLEAKIAAQDYVNQWLSDREHPLSECFYQDLKVCAVSEEGTYFRISLRMVFKPETEESLSYWLAGNTKEGTGENKGYLTAGRFVEVEKLDGTWTITDHGTGGFATGAEGIQEVDWAIG